MLLIYSIFTTNSYFPQFIQEYDLIEKNTSARQSEFLLIRADKIAMLSFINLSIELALMSHKKGMLWRLLMLSFMSLGMDLMMMSDKRDSCFSRSYVSHVYAERLYSS